MTQTYYESVQLIERLHRHFLDVLKVELERRNIRDINNVQSMILYNIGDDNLTVGELTMRGYYLGSNVSYNVKKMSENGYIIQERSIHDKRSIRVHLSEKGLKLRDQIRNMFDRHFAGLGEQTIDEEQLKSLNDVLLKLERFWTNQHNYSTASGAF